MSASEEVAREVRSSSIHADVVNRLSWSPSGRSIAAASHDGTITITDYETETCIRFGEGHGRVWTVSWSPGETRLATVDDEAVRLWDVKTRQVLRIIPIPSAPRCARFASRAEILAIGTDSGRILLYNHRTPARMQSLNKHLGAVESLAWSPSGRLLASGGRDGAVVLWDVDATLPLRTLGADQGMVRTVVWSRSGNTIATGWNDGTVRFFNTSGTELRVIEAHRKGISDLSFSYGDRFFASRSWDNTVRIWLCDTWDLLAVLDVRASPTSFAGLAFHPEKPLLAAHDDTKGQLRLWQISPPRLENSLPPSFHYRNAKVVLAGDTGVGKTGLRLRLLEVGYRPVDSSHGRYVERLEETFRTDSEGNRVTCELLLWDLAGNPGYRVVNQLHLDQITVGVVVFDARSERDPFAGVAYWARALDRAVARRQPKVPLIKFLVAARIDRGRPLASQLEIKAVCTKFGFSAYFETSAKEDRGVRDLKQAILDAVPWDCIPTRIAPRVLREVMLQVQKYREGDATLIPRLGFLKSLRTQVPGLEQSEISITLESLETVGLLRELSFGGLLLLQPEALDAYCAAVALEARADPRGFGFVPEAKVLSGAISLDADRPLRGMHTIEAEMLLATIQEVVDLEIAIRVQTEKGSELGFPSEGTRQRPAVLGPYTPELGFDFKGPVNAIFSTLAIRLANSMTFGQYDLFKDAATFQTVNGHVSGFVVCFPDLEDEGTGRLEVFFGGSIPQEIKLLFLRYINRELTTSTVPGSVRRERIYFHCGLPITNAVVQERKRRGHKTIFCPICESCQPMDELEEQASEHEPLVDQLVSTARENQERQSRLAVLPEHQRRREYDVFISYHQPDRDAADLIFRALREQGLNAWFDQINLLPGQVVVTMLEGAMASSKAAILLIGRSWGQWQKSEYECLIQRQVEDPNFTLIPLILPGAELPQEQFLRRLLVVNSSHRSVDSPVTIAPLVQAILGRIAAQN